MLGGGSSAVFVIGKAEPWAVYNEEVMCDKERLASS